MQPFKKRGGSAKRAAVFLDRDGVINEDRPDYVKSWEEFRFIRGVRPALRRLREAGIPVVVITNQSAVNRGLLSREGLETIHARMVRAIEKAGGRIDGIYYCPHRPDEGCDCRKPGTGLLKLAARKLGLGLKQSVFLGDTFKDLEAGEKAGCRTILVLSGQGRETLKKMISTATPPNDLWITRDLLHSVDLMFRLFTP